eukprot:6200650-Pleurochrysis_carterae.AAC.1
MTEPSEWATTTHTPPFSRNVGLCTSHARKSSLARETTACCIRLRCFSCGRARGGVDRWAGR